jgi:type I restriction enzyme S subunit
LASKVKTTTTTTAPTMNSNLRKGWQLVRFDELAQMVNERVDPSNTDAEIYVGLEHLDPDSLKLRRWGTPSDVIGDKLQFRIGDIIFGRRRAYQRKLAVAEFDGICSAHAMVVRARNETVDPEFLPFLMQSDLFMQRAIDISVGSLSPTINWSTLRIQEFPLPPKDVQRRIAEILWAADQVVESYRAATSDLRRLFDVAKSELLGQGSAFTMSPEILQTTIGNAAEIEMGTSPPGDSYNSDGKGVALLNGPTEFGERYPAAQQWTTKPTKFCKPGDILFCVRGSTTGRQNIADAVFCLGRGLAAVRGLDGISRTGYLRYILQLMEKRILGIAKGAGSTFPNMNKKAMQEWPVFLPSLSDQDRIVCILDELETQLTRLSVHTKMSENTKRQLVNELIVGRHQIRE